MLIHMKSNNGITKYLPTIQQFLTICAAIAALGGAFIAYKLSPVLADISLLKYQVSALDTTYARKDTVETGFKHIGEKMDKIEAKLDRLIEK